MPITVIEEAGDARFSNRKLAATIGKSTIFGIVARWAQIGTRFVTIPIVIAHLGLGGYGIWSIIMTTAAYMRFGSVGIKAAFQKYVADATGDGDFERANKLLSTGCAVMLGLSLIGLIPVAFLSHRLAKAAGVPPEFLSSAAGAISVLAVIMVLSNVGSVYEAIVMGGHRVDLIGKSSVFITVAESTAIVVVLHFGYGLLAMSIVMAMSGLASVVVCFRLARKVMPQVRVRWQFVTTSVVRELVRFAGSYQLVNVLEVLYASILPVAVLRVFGADASGVYAVVTRLTSSVLMFHDAFLLPILSGGAMVYASGLAQNMRVLLIKSYKVTLGLSLLPLAFLSAFGTTIVLAWTGQTDPSFRIAMYLVCLAGPFKAFSLLGLVLYRVSGKAVLDNIRQGLRIVILLLIAIFARRLGFYGILSGLAVAELVGALFMLYAIRRTFPLFRLRDLLPDTLKLSLASVLILAAGFLSSLIPLPLVGTVRTIEAFRLGLICMACLAAVWPALMISKSVSPAEGKTLLSVFLLRRAKQATV
jgi:O-antigen/teichoic acid export membrane protein